VLRKADRRADLVTDPYRRRHRRWSRFRGEPAPDPADKGASFTHGGGDEQKRPEDRRDEAQPLRRSTASKAPSLRGCQTAGKRRRAPATRLDDELDSKHAIMREWFDGDGSWPSEMFDREENGREPPYGPALDLGTGSGIWGVQLAKREALQANGAE
jgi:hypothetical protein